MDSIATGKSLVLFADSSMGTMISAILAKEGALVKSIVLKEGIDASVQDSILAPWSSSSPEILRWKTGASEDDLIRRLENLTFDIGLLAWWPFILSERLIAMAGETFLNLHPSFLPYGRGKDPNFWALVDKTPFGVTIHHVVRAVDKGPVAFQRIIPVGPLDTGETLYQKALSELEQLFQEVCPRIMRGDIPAIEQPSAGVEHKRRDLEVASQIHLDQNYSGADLLDLLRARTFSPHPGCWFEKDEKRYEVRVSISEVPVKPSSREP
jgi:methionyl-tRNA formyltransferase